MKTVLNIEGTEVAIVGLGTWGLSGRSCKKAVDMALNLGYRHLDTAQMYGNEAEVGMGIRESGINPESVFVTTKVATSNLNPGSIRSSTESSLDKLGTIDLLLIHWPTPEMNLEECLDEMFRLKEEGKIKNVGVSNFNPDLFRKSLELGKIICNQVEFSPYRHQDENLQIAKDAGIMVTAYSPLDKGKVSRDRLLKEIANQYGKTAAQVTLRWLIQHGNTSVIPKSGGEKHLEENIGIFDFELSEEDMDRISSQS